MKYLLAWRYVLEECAKCKFTRFFHFYKVHLWSNTDTYQALNLPYYQNHKDNQNYKDKYAYVNVSSIK